MDLPEGKLAAWHVLNWENEGTSSTNQGFSCAMFDYRRVLSVEVFRMGPGCFLRREAKRSHQWQDKSAGKFLKN